jgi:hypothetical protein
MKTLLRHASTGKYFQSLTNGREREQAHDFGIVRRIKFAEDAHFDFGTDPVI